MSPTAQFDEPLAAGSVTPQSFQLLDPSGAAVAATVSYDASSHTATLNPSAPLASGTKYKVVVHGGSGGVTDVAGNALANDQTWTFTTASTCPCTIWPTSAVPTTLSVGDNNSYELGMKFRSDVAGYVTGVRFYKGLGNTGTHLGHLWSSTGNQLGETTFTNETATGWQQAQFSTPIPIAANTTYVVSYFAPNGGFSLDRPYFTSPVDSDPLHALADGTDGSNGVYNGGSVGFPTSSYAASNYWVDVVFTTTP